jgi:hypothetical protein
MVLRPRRVHLVMLQRLRPQRSLERSLPAMNPSAQRGRSYSAGRGGMMQCYGQAYGLAPLRPQKSPC